MSRRRRTGCRGSPAHLEQQRTDDHKHFLEIRDHCLKLGAELDKKTEKEAEIARYPQELTARGLQFQQALVLQKVALEQSVKKAQEETFKIASGTVDVKIAGMLWVRPMPSTSCRPTSCRLLS